MEMRAAFAQESPAVLALLDALAGLLTGGEHRPGGVNRNLGLAEEVIEFLVLAACFERSI